MAVLCADISNNQPGSNIEAAAGFLQSWVFKVTEGTGFRDSWFAGWAKRSNAVHTPWAGYHFAHPGNASGAQEAQFFCDTLEAAGAGIPWRVVLDFEVTSTSPSATTVYALQWLNYVAQRWPQVARTLYTYPYFSPSYVPDPALAQMADLWIAAYPYGYNGVPNPDTIRQQAPVRPWDHWIAWQFTSIARVPGVPGNSDLSTVTPAWLLGGSPSTQGDDMTQAQVDALTLYAVDTHNKAIALTQGGDWGPYVDDLYTTWLGRPSDPAGKALWVAALRSGTSPSDVQTAFRVSPEGNKQAIAVVEKLYLQDLGRPVDPAGLLGWVDQIQNHGLTEAQLDTALKASPEGQAYAQAHPVGA